MQNSSSAKFLDSSVFLHAYLKPTRKLTAEERQVKEAAAAIIGRVERGEVVLTSVVHVSEVANIVEARLGLAKALVLLEKLLTMANVDVVEVTRGVYEQALAVASRYKVSPNDAMAFIIARSMNARAIYSFDRHYDNLPGVARETS